MRNFFKKHSKKCLIAFLATACALSVTACNKDDGESTTPESTGSESTVHFELNQTQAAMLLGDQLLLKAADASLTGITWQRFGFRYA